MTFTGNPLACDASHVPALRDFRDCLARMDFSPSGLVSLLKLKQESRLYPLEYRELPRYASILEQTATPLADTAQLLVLGLPVSRAAAERGLGPRNLGLLDELGLCSVDGETVHANFTLLPFGDLMIVTDRIFPNVDGNGRDESLSSDNLVWRLDQTSWIMARHLIRQPAREALDLGCGSGLQALLLSGWADNVTGVDINPRAVGLAKFNARLNGIGNVQFFGGNLFQPVNGRSFGQIISNPPSAPGQVRAWNREGGATGREVVESIIDGLGSHLETGGIFQSTLHLGYRNEEDIAKWLEARLPRDEYRCLVLKHRSEEEADDYCLREAYQKAGPRDYEIFRRTFGIYRDNLGRAGIERIAFGVVAARRATGGGPPEIRTDDLQVGKSPDWLKVLIS